MSALIYLLKSKVFNFDLLKMCYRTKKSRRGLLLLHHNYKNFLVNQNELERNFEPLKQTKKSKKKNNVCLSTQLVVFISPNPDFLQ